MSIDDIVDRYHRDGYALVHDLLSDAEVGMLQAVTDQVSAQAMGAEGETPIFDFEDGHTPEEPRIQRIKKPHRVDPFYNALARHSGILSIVRKLIGENVRLSHSKINMKGGPPRLAARVASGLGLRPAYQHGDLRRLSDDRRHRYREWRDAGFARQPQGAADRASRR